MKGMFRDSNAGVGVDSRRVHLRGGDELQTLLSVWDSRVHVHMLSILSWDLGIEYNVIALGNN